MITLAYGGFASNDYWYIVTATVPKFLILVVPPVLLYVACSIAAERINPGIYRAVAALGYGLVFALIAPSLMVMGEYGPAHVAFHAGVHAWPTFMGGICVKVAILWFIDIRRQMGTTDSK